MCDVDVLKVVVKLVLIVFARKISTTEPRRHSGTQRHLEELHGLKIPLTVNSWKPQKPKAPNFKPQTQTSNPSINSSRSGKTQPRTSNFKPQTSNLFLERLLNHSLATWQSDIYKVHTSVQGIYIDPLIEISLLFPDVHTL